MTARLPGSWRPELAEAIATFSLVLAGCGAIVVDSLTGQLGHLGIALTFALVICVMVYATGHVSGAHINPAITVAFAATGHFPWRRVPRYIGAQVAGGMVAAGILRSLWGATALLGTTTVAPGLGVWQAVVLEVLATGLLAFVIASVATDARAQAPAAGLAIGLAVGAGSLFIGPMTGGSLNPARSIAPALVSGQLTHLWLYLAAPVAGAVVAMGLYEVVRAGTSPHVGRMQETPEASAEPVEVTP